MIRHFLIIIFLVLMQSCGSIHLSLNELLPVSTDVEQPNSVEQHLEVSIIQMGEDVEISWNDINDDYIVLRAWSYPDNKKSWQKVATTSDTKIVVKGAYWSGRHYYKVQTKNCESGYTMYCPK